jgi:hypothetical protein
MSATDASQEVTTDALAERLFSAAIDTLEIASVHVGGRLGFYRALAEDGPATAGSPLAPAPPSATFASGSSSRPWPAS